jgi:hypothetical protein
VLFSGYCASCHSASGAGSTGQAYPALFHNTATGGTTPANLVSAILFGVERKIEGEEHEAFMPRFDQRSYVQPLTDEQIASIANYVLKQYGNPDVSVTPPTWRRRAAAATSPCWRACNPSCCPLAWRARAADRAAGVAAPAPPAAGGSGKAGVNLNLRRNLQ